MEFRGRSEGPYLVANTLEERLAVAPAEDEKSEEKLKDKSPTDVTPDDVLSALGEDGSQSYYHQYSASRNQSFPVSLRIDHQEDPDDKYD